MFHITFEWGQQETELKQLGGFPKILATMQIGAYYVRSLFTQENTKEQTYTDHKTRIHR